MALSFRGSAHNSAVNANADLTVTFPGGVAQDDVVVGVYGIAGTADVNMAVTDSGYTEWADNYVNATQDANIGIYVKVLGASPDSSITYSGVGASGVGMAGLVHIWTGADTTTPLDNFLGGSTASGSTQINSPSLTTVTANAVMLSVGVASVFDTAVTAPAGYTNQVDDSGDGSGTDILVVAASKLIASPGAEDPAGWTNIAAIGSNPAWLGYSLAIRPATTVTINFDWFRPLSEPRAFATSQPRQEGMFAMPPAIQPAFDNANVRWHRPFSEPQRPKRDPKYNTAFTGGAFSPPAIQPGFDNANVRWHRQFSEPQRFRDQRYIPALSASGEVKWPTNQPALDNANVRWFRPLTEPVRYLRDPRYSAALYASGDTKWPLNQPASDNANVNWYRPLTEPQRFPRDLRYRAAFVGGPTQWPVIQSSFDAANVNWYRPLSEPRREARPASRMGGEFSYPVAPSIAVAPTVTADMWFVAWQMPVRRTVRLNGSLLDPINTTSPSLAGWWLPFSMPVRPPRDGRYTAAFSWIKESSWPVPVVVIDAIAWHQALAEPRRFLRDPRWNATLTASGLTWNPVGSLSTIYGKSSGDWRMALPFGFWNAAWPDPTAVYAKHSGRWQKVWPI